MPERSRLLFVLVLMSGILGTGFLNFVLSQQGASQLADFTWIVGYGSTVFVLWYGWIRPIDFGGEDTDSTDTQ